MTRLLKSIFTLLVGISITAGFGPTIEASTSASSSVYDRSISSEVSSQSLATQFSLAAFSQDCGSLNGIKLPCWPDYLDSNEGSESLPYYPYAKRPNGCSIPGARPGANDSINMAGINISFTDICNKHDRCYYTLGTTPWECNSPFESGLRARCEREVSDHAMNGWDIFTGGTSRATVLATCYGKAEIIALSVIGTQSIYHTEAQDTQQKYLRRVDNYLESVSGLSFGNETTKPVWVAVGYYDGGWVSEGWWRIEPGQTKTLHGGKLTQRYYYYYAENGANLVWEGDYNFWIHPTNAFGPISNSLSQSEATRQGYEQQGFQQIDTGDYTGYTLNLID